MARLEGSTPLAPKPVGPYSQSVRIGNVVACAGQGGVLVDGTLVHGIEAQTRQTLDNLVATLKASDATMTDVIQMRVYLTKTEDFATMNAVYGEYFHAPFPARTTVYVTLPREMLVEIDALAIVEVR